MAENLIEESEAPVVDQQPTPKKTSYISDLRDNLIHAYGESNVPDEATFTKRITSDTKYLKDIHDNLIHAYGEDNVPDLNTFTDKVKKKDGTSISPSSPSQFISPLPSKSWNDQLSQGIADNGLLKQISKQATSDTVSKATKHVTEGTTESKEGKWANLGMNIVDNINLAAEKLAAFPVNIIRDAISLKEIHLTLLVKY